MCCGVSVWSTARLLALYEWSVPFTVRRALKQIILFRSGRKISIPASFIKCNGHYLNFPHSPD